MSSREGSTGENHQFNSIRKKAVRIGANIHPRLAFCFPNLGVRKRKVSKPMNVSPKILMILENKYMNLILC